jgi:hypothetical protein
MTEKTKRTKYKKTKSVVLHRHVSLAWLTLCQIANTQQQAQEQSDEEN